MGVRFSDDYKAERRESRRNPGKCPAGLGVQRRCPLKYRHRNMHTNIQGKYHAII
jgi:hypothetical protein